MSMISDELDFIFKKILNINGEIIFPWNNMGLVII